MTVIHIRKLRVANGLAQRDLAETAGVDLALLNKIERGLVPLGAAERDRIAIALGVDGHELEKGHAIYMQAPEAGEGYVTFNAGPSEILPRSQRPPADRFKVLDLFCGCGGLSYGFEMTGRFAVTAGIDLLSDRIGTFRANHPYATTIAADIRKLPSAFIDEMALRPDVIVGGPPCQGFSSIRPFRTLTEGDARNTLIEEYVAIVGAIRPRWFVFENVVGLLRHSNGKPFLDLLRGFQDAGYTTDWRVINMAALGLPQNRERLVIVGSAEGMEYPWPEPTHATSYRGMAGRSAKRLRFSREPAEPLKPAVTVGEAIADLPPVASGQEADHYVHSKSTEYTRAMRGDCDILTLHSATLHSDKMLNIIRHAGSSKAALPPGLVSSGFSSCYSRLDANQPSVTLTVNFVHPASNRCIHPVQHRALTPREGARLQGFPDRFIFKGSRAQIVKQIGNAVPPLLGKIIADRVAFGLRGKVLAD